jgi:hypothetical protein
MMIVIYDWITGSPEIVQDDTMDNQRNIDDYKLDIRLRARRLGV